MWKPGSFGYWQEILNSSLDTGYICKSDWSTVGSLQPRWDSVVDLHGCSDPNAELGSPREKGYSESFSGKLRVRLRNGEVFCTLKKAQLDREIASRVQHHQPHSALGYRAPALKATLSTIGRLLTPTSGSAQNYETFLSYPFS